MGNGSSDSDISNDGNFCVDSFDKIIGTGIKSNDRCRDAGDECVGYYDASILTNITINPQSSGPDMAPG